MKINFDQLAPLLGYTSNKVRTEAQNKALEGFSKGLASMIADSKESPLSATVIPDSQDAIDLSRASREMDLDIRSKDTDITNASYGTQQGIKTNAVNTQADNYTKNVRTLLGGTPFGALENLSAERRASNQEFLDYGKSENAADRDLRRSENTQDLISRLALGAAILFS